MVHDCMLDKVLNKIKEIIGIETLGNTVTYPGWLRDWYVLGSQKKYFKFSFFSCISSKIMLM